MHIRPQEGGFTLLALLAAVFVVAVLAVIAIPKASATREAAYFAELKSDLKNLRSQQEIFHADHGRFSEDQDSLVFTAVRDVRVSILADSTRWSAIALRVVEPTLLCRASSADDEVRCEKLAVPAPVSRLDSMVARLPWAATALKAPAHMRVGQTRTVTLLLDPTYTPASGVDTVTLPADIRDSLRAGLVGEDTLATVDFKPVRRAEKMLARLEGPGFAIDPAPSQDSRLKKGVPEGRRTEWRWDVTAVSGGTQVLRVTLYALMNLDGETPVEFQVLRHEIEVDVTWTDYLAGFAERNWMWLIMLLLAPPSTIVWLVKRYKGGKRKPAPDWQTPL